MIGHPRWQDNWRVLGAAGATRVKLRPSRAAQRAAEQTIASLPPGASVVLVASAPGALGRCRRFAAAAAIELEREYLAFPSAEAPAYLVEDAPASVRVFVETVLVAPFRTALAAPLDALLGLVRASSPWWLIRRLAPGRVVVGTRT